MLPAVEVLVEGLARDAGDLDHVDDARLGVAPLGDHLDHPRPEPSTLRITHRLARAAVPAAGQPFVAPSQAPAASAYDSDGTAVAPAQSPIQIVCSRSGPTPTSRTGTPTNSAMKAR